MLSERQNELDVIFSQPADKISAKTLDQFSARIFSECMSKLNEQMANLEQVKKAQYPNSEDRTRDKIKIEGNIKALKVDYNTYIQKLQDHITASCKDRKSAVAWLKIAARCQKNGNDMVGYAIRNSLFNPAINNAVKFVLKISLRFRILRKNYLDKFNAADYPTHLMSLPSAISPSFPLIFSKYETVKTKRYECAEAFRIHQLLNNNDWGNAIPIISPIELGDENGKKATIAQLANILPAHLSKQDLVDIFDLIQKYAIKKPQSLEKIIENMEKYLRNFESSPEKIYLEKFNQAINPELIHGNLFQTYQPITIPTIPPAIEAAEVKVEKEPTAAPKVSRTTNETLSMPEISKLYPKVINAVMAINEDPTIKKVDFYKMKREFDHAMIFLEDTNLIRQQDPNAVMQSLLEKELKYAVRVHDYINGLRALNAHPDDVNQLAKGFNLHVQGMLHEAKLLKDPGLVKSISQLAVTVTNNKGKEEERTVLTASHSRLFNAHTGKKTNNEPGADIRNTNIKPK